MISAISFLLGFVILVLQSGFELQSIYFMTVDYPFSVMLLMMSILIVLQLFKIVLSLYIKEVKEPYIKIMCFILIVVMSSSTIFLMHYSIDRVVSGNLNHSDNEEVLSLKEKLNDLKKEKEHYYIAIEKGVVKSAQPQIDKLDLKIQDIESKITDIKKISSKPYRFWAFFISLISEVVFIASLYISSFYYLRDKNSKGMASQGDLMSREHHDVRRSSVLSIETQQGRVGDGERKQDNKLDINDLNYILSKLQGGEKTVQKTHEIREGDVSKILPSISVLKTEFGVGYDKAKKIQFMIKTVIEDYKMTVYSL